jgi:tetratricopeptide (TPR) repeat protein
VNSAGITFAVHQNYTHSQHLGGWPMFLVGEKVLREARNLREAEAILQRHRTSPIWTFVVSDLKTGEIMAIEMSQNIFRKRMMHDPDASLNKGEFVQTNDLQHAETTPYEFIQPGHLLNSQERFNKALEKLLAWTPQDNNNPYRALQKILSYSARSDGYLNAHQDIIKAHTIQSVIFANPQINTDLKQVRIAVSHKPAPTASGEFISFSLPELFSPQKLLSINTIPGITNSAVRKEQMSFAKAFAASFDRQDYADAIRLLDKQKAPNALLAKGVFAQKIGRLADAATYFQQAKQASEIKPLPLPHLIASIDFAILLNRYAQTNDPEQLRPLAAAVLANTQNHWQKKVSSKILERKKLGRLERSLAFDYFSGDLTSEPYTPQ